MSKYEPKYSYIVVYRQGDSNFKILEIDNKTNQIANVFDFEKKINIMVD